VLRQPVSASTEPVIFHCDGVLVDSDITARSLPMTSEDCSREFLGIGMESTVEMIAGMLGRPVPDDWLDELEAEVEETFRRDLQALP
jgi:hypothetical protein